MQNLSRVLLLLLSVALGAQSTAPDAGKDLAGHLASLKDARTLQVQFFCQKNLALLDSPLVSAGELLIRRDEKGVSVRFSTQRPYVSELILTGGKTYARSQHEEKWTITNQSARPGLTAVMLQLSGWSTGEAGKIGEMYTVERSGDAVPARPQVVNSGIGGAPATAPAARSEQAFELTPTNKDLAIAIKRVRVAMDKPDAGPSRLTFVEITTAQDDVTRYWFFDGKINVPLPADAFAPEQAPAGGKP